MVRFGYVMFRKYIELEGANVTGRLGLPQADPLNRKPENHWCQHIITTMEAEVCSKQTTGGDTNVLIL